MDDPLDLQVVERFRDHDLAPIRQLVDLAVDESVALTIGDETVRIQLKGIEDRRDSVHGALTDSRIRLLVNDEDEDWCTVGTYNLPKRIGPVRIDCLTTASYITDAQRDAWGLDKHALLRVWPASGPLLTDSLRYPLNGDWFHSQSQVACESIYVNAWMESRSVQYQPHCDIGGCVGVAVLSAAESLVLAIGDSCVDGLRELRARMRSDVIITLDRRGWIILYAHLDSVESGIQPGDMLRQGQQLGTLGKAGPSGGWSHLHFEVQSQRPTGGWGNEDSYCYLLEEWTERNDLDLVACARPHRKVKIGEPVILSGRSTWARDGADLDYWWNLPGGRSELGRDVIWTPIKAGTYSATLGVEDGRGNSDADPCIIQVHEPGIDTLTIHAALTPSAGVRVNEELEVRVRSFNNPEANGEVIDWGDATDDTHVYSDGNVDPDANGYAIARHRYDLPGTYRIRVRAERADGQQAEVTLVAKVTS